MSERMEVARAYGHVELNRIVLLRGQWFQFIIHISKFPVETYATYEVKLTKDGKLILHGDTEAKFELWDKES